MPVNGNVNGLAIMQKGRLVDVDMLECKLIQARRAIVDLLNQKPMLAAMKCGNSTLGNLLAELGNAVDNDYKIQHVPESQKGARCPYCNADAI